MKTIADNTQLIWHLTNNVTPSLTKEAMDKILETVNDFNAGKLTLADKIHKDSPVTVAEMFDDLKIELI